MKKIALLLIVLAAMIGIANAGTPVTANIGASGPETVTWTKANSPYNLVGQIYVLSGSTLVIEAGVVVASKPADLGSLAVCSGADIYVNGTQEEPVIMTSTTDVATWTGSVMDGQTVLTMGDPKTGTWHEGCNEWGNLTIMGKGLISASHYGGNPVTYKVAGVTYTNTKYPDGTNKKKMEGLTAADPNDHTNILYGGNDDNDDSGSIRYLSLRYGGKVVSLANELNGLSLGALGRATDISHIEIMNNVDDGIEIWGGTVQLDHVSIWNIGDDSLDCDEGWRGSATNGLIVQGYSVSAAQGSGVGDNVFEIDGAEDSDAQPLTTARISKFTVVGQYQDGDHCFTYRDGARVQYDSCIVTDIGEIVLKNDNVDGDGAHGYAYNGQLSWVDTWTTSYDTWKTSAASINLGSGNLDNIYGAYMTQDPAGNLNQITNSVFCDNTLATAYNEFNSRGCNSAAFNNRIYMSDETQPSPITEVTRGASVVKGGKTMYPVTFINPLPIDGVTAGGFSTCNWLVGWTSTSAYGMTSTAVKFPNADANCDGSVDLGDFMVLSTEWLN